MKNAKGVLIAVGSGVAGLAIGAGVGYAAGLQVG